MSTGNKIDEAKSWCLEARRILKLGKRGDLKSRASKIAQQLAALEKQVLARGLDKAVLEEYVKRFHSLSKSLHESRDERDVEMISNRLSELKKELAVKLAERKGGKTQHKAEDKLASRQASNIPNELQLLDRKIGKAKFDFAGIAGLMPRLDTLEQKHKDAATAHQDDRLDDARRLLDELLPQVEKFLTFANQYKDVATMHRIATMRVAEHEDNTWLTPEVTYIRKNYLDASINAANKGDFKTADDLLTQVSKLVDTLEETSDRIDTLVVDHNAKRDAMHESDFKKIPTLAPDPSLAAAHSAAVRAYEQIPRPIKTEADLKKAIAQIKIVLEKTPEYMKAEKELLDVERARYAKARDEVFDASIKDLPEDPPEGLEAEYADLSAAWHKLPEELPEIADTQWVYDALDEIKALRREYQNPKSLGDYFEEFKELKDRLEAAEKVSRIPLVKRIQARIIEREKALRKEIEKKGKNIRKLLALLKEDLGRIEQARLDSDSFRKEHNLVLLGPHAKASKLKLEPKELDDACRDGLSRSSANVTALANAGKFAPGRIAIAAWKKQAEQWIRSAALAKKVFAELGSGVGDGPELQALLASDASGIVDDMVMALGPKPSKKVIKGLMKARFGIDLELNKLSEKDSPAGSEGEIEDQWDVQPDGKDSGSKSLRKIYQLMAKVPSTHTTNNPSLKGIVRYGGSKGKTAQNLKGTPIRSVSSYSSDKKVIRLACGRVDKSFPYLDRRETADVDENCQPRSGKKSPTYFDWTTLHEIGHAVDDATSFMNKKLGNPKFGGWRDHKADTGAVAQAAADHFKVGNSSFGVADVIGLLEGKTGKNANSNPAPANPGEDAGQWASQWAALIQWCESIRCKTDPWEQSLQAIDGRVYHESYPGSWVSYAAEGRKQRIAHYQFRAPGEWFAELYAAYHSEMLQDNHPAVPWLEVL